MALSNNSTGLRTGVCTSTTRPVNPYEGQMIYETDTDLVCVWNGTAWRNIAAATATNGSVLQVVYGSTSSQITSATTTPVDTGLTATITPKSSSSKVLVCIQQNGLLKITNDTYMVLNSFRDAINIGTIGTQIAVTGLLTTAGVGGAGAMILDAPATTTATTYKTSFYSGANLATVACQHAGATSTIVLMEIAG